MKEIKLEQFSGPLDLLLALIEQEELNINDIALSKVTEQFFEHLNKLEENRSEELADFLVIATKLVFMKSKNLLPQLVAEEEDGPTLAEQLKMYKRYIEASQVVSQMWGKNNIGYARLEPPVKADGFILPANGQTDDLQKSFLNLLRRLKPINPLPKVNIDRAMTVKARLDSIYDLLKKHRRLNFSDLLSSAENKTEVIISFLALLELVKSGFAAVKQDESFSNLEILKV